MFADYMVAAADRARPELLATALILSQLSAENIYG
jgi:hypothetical protein